MRRLSSAVLLLLFAFACDSSSSEDEGITGRFSGLIPPLVSRIFTLDEHVLTLVLTETGGVVGGVGTIAHPDSVGSANNLSFTVSGTVTESNFSLGWKPFEGVGIFSEATYEGRLDPAANLSGFFRLDLGIDEDITVDNLVLRRE